MSSYIQLEAEAVQRKKDYCSIEGICYTCWQQDPVDMISLDPVTHMCPNCDEWTEFQMASAPLPLSESSSPLSQTPSLETSQSYDNQEQCLTHSSSDMINKTCWGCLEDQLNQLAHMDIGGCLYSEE